MGGAVAAIVLAAGGAQAQAPAARPGMSQQEAYQLVSAAGFTMRGAQPVNSCGKPTQPGFAFTDMNGDGRPEAIIGDLDPACYAVNGARSHVLRKEPSGQWRLIGIAAGRIKLLPTRTSGWRDYTVEGQGCQRTWTYEAAQGQYFSLQPCPGESGYRPPGAPPPKAAPAVGAAGDRVAALRAAGFTPTRGRYLACDPRQELGVEVRDINGDGRLDALITNYGTECFGHTGQGFALVTKGAGGAWRKLYESQGIPEFQASRGVGGWPDIVNGGPGLCFPVLRWNGSDYAFLRWKAEQPGACAGRR